MVLPSKRHFSIDTGDLFSLPGHELFKEIRGRTGMCNPVVYLRRTSDALLKP